MKYLLIFIITFGFFSNGNWWLNDGLNNFKGEWQANAMKVTGDEGTCFWLGDYQGDLIRSEC